MTGLCAVLLAAGEGRRLRPLTGVVPKALCPVGNIALLDRALAAVAGLGFTGPDRVAVNAWHLAGAIVDHIGTGSGRAAHVGVETGPAPLGSAGGLAALRDWIDGRDVLVGNADAYLTGGDPHGLLTGWSGDRVRLLGVPAGDRPAEFGPYRFAGFSVIPWRYLAALEPVPDDLVRTVWRPAEAAGELDVVDYRGFYLDCGTPADYLAANLHAAGAVAAGAGAGATTTRATGRSLIAASAVVTGSVRDSVVGAGARVAGAVDRCVVWPGATVAAGERLSGAIRYGTATLPVEPVDEKTA